MIEFAIRAQVGGRPRSALFDDARLMPTTTTTTTTTTEFLVISMVLTMVNAVSGLRHRHGLYGCAWGD